MNLWRRDEEERMETELMNEIATSAALVWRELGARFSPQVYRAALGWELRQLQIPVADQPLLTVKYQGRVVGEFQPDLLVGERVLVELEVARKLQAARLRDARCALAATRLSAGVLVNFGAPKLEIKRFERAV